jgi:hypothetical protein
VAAHPALAPAARAAGVLSLVLEALHTHAHDDAALAAAACWALSSLCGGGDTSVDTLNALASVSATVTRAATVVLAAHGAQSARCATTAALTIGNWCNLMRIELHDTGASAAARGAGAVSALALAMEASPADVIVQQTCARALVALTDDNAHAHAHAADYVRALDAAVAALLRHAADSRNVAYERAASSTTSRKSCQSCALQCARRPRRP